MIEDNERSESAIDHKAMARAQKKSAYMALKQEEVIEMLLNAEEILLNARSLGCSNVIHVDFSEGQKEALKSIMLAQEHNIMESAGGKVLIVGCGSDYPVINATVHGVGHETIDGRSGLIGMIGGHAPPAEIHELTMRPEIPDIVMRDPTLLNAKPKYPNPRSKRGGKHSLYKKK